MKLRITSAVLLIIGTVVSGLSAQDGAALYQKYCAECHGKNGDGAGWKQVWPLPRNFRDGGFSFGNTEEAILRTLTNGIPGTPMASFGESVAEADRLALARYVRSFLPKDRLVEPDAGALTVTEKAVVVRGYLGDIEGEEFATRGLVVGLPGGLTLAYRTDTLRLLTVTRGPFLSREDWRGRGGTPIKLLGRPFWRPAHSEALGWFEAGPFGRRRLDVVLAKTVVDKTTVRFVSELVRQGDGHVIATVEETVRLESLRGAVGYSRTFVFAATKADTSIVVALDGLPEHHRWVTPLPSVTQQVGPLGLASLNEHQWLASKSADGPFRLLRLETPEGVALHRSGEAVALFVPLVAGATPCRITVAFAQSPTWDEAVQETLDSDLN